MKIYAADHHSWIEINRFVDEANGYINYDLSVFIDIQHGQYTTKNKDAHLLNIEEFNSEFDRFITNRSLRPKLEGTYDSYLEFAGISNNVILRFKIMDAFCGIETVDYIFEGAFEVSQESLLSIHSQFVELTFDA